MAGVLSTGRGNSTRITIPKASQSEICENHGAGALRWNHHGGGTQLEFISEKVPGQIFVTATGRGHSKGIFLCKGAWSDIYQNTRAGALPGITIPKASQSEICGNHGAGALNLE